MKRIPSPLVYSNHYTANSIPSSALCPWYDSSALPTKPPKENDNQSLSLSRQYIPDGKAGLCISKRISALVDWRIIASMIFPKPS